MVMEVVHEEMGDGSLQCTNHPYRNSSPSGICAFCLQEKLGKLVSSSFPASIFPSSSSSTSSSSSSPTFRSEFCGSTASSATGTAAAALSASSSQNGCNYHGYYTTRRSKLPFVLTHQQNKKNVGGGATTGNSDSSAIAFNRSKSTATPRRGMHLLDENYAEDYSPHRRGFWSFLYLSKHSTTKKNENKHYKDLQFASATPSTVGSSSMVNGVRLGETKGEEFVVVEENESPNEASFDRKVSRSRSVGCGSRSFSGEFFERISTGFGDCTLRRVESQREGKPKMIKNGGLNGGQDCIKERLKCGGIFSGFMITSSSSSSSSSSYWDSNNNLNGKRISAVHSSNGNVSHGRSKSWGWALASPMRAFSKPSVGKREANSRKNTTPDLNSIPSLLSVSG